MTQKETSFKNIDQAADAVCQAFARLGDLAGVDVNSGEGPADLDADLIRACYQSNFSDPHFLGGPCCFQHAGNMSQVDRIATAAFDVSSRLVKYIGHNNDAVKTKAAQDAAAIISQAITWLTKVVNASR
jgi:hypothetical protein